MGKPAARLSDMHTCPLVTPGTPPIPHVGGIISGPGCPTVLIGNMPAATVGDMCICVGPPDTVAIGSTGVLIGGKPAARIGDTTAHGGVIVAGCPTVLIGETSGGGGAGDGGAAGGGDADAQNSDSEDAESSEADISQSSPKFLSGNLGDISPIHINPLILALINAAKKGNIFCEVCQKSDNQLEAEKKANRDFASQMAEINWNAEKQLRKDAAINGTPFMQHSCPCDKEQELLNERWLSTNPNIIKNLKNQSINNAKSGIPFSTICE